MERIKCVLYNETGKLCTILKKKYILAELDGAPLLVNVNLNFSGEKDSLISGRISCEQTKKWEPALEASYFLNSCAWLNGTPVLLSYIDDGMELEFDAIFSDRKGYEAVVVWKGRKPIFSPILNANEFMLSEVFHNIPIHYISYEPGDLSVYIWIDGCIKKMNISCDTIDTDGISIKSNDDLAAIIYEMSLDHLAATIYKLITSYHQYIYFCSRIYLKNFDKPESTRPATAKYESGCIFKFNLECDLIPSEPYLLLYFDIPVTLKKIDKYYHLHFTLEGKEITMDYDKRYLPIMPSQNAERRLAHLVYDIRANCMNTWKVLIMKIEEKGMKEETKDSLESTSGEAKYARNLIRQPLRSKIIAEHKIPSSPEKVGIESVFTRTDENKEILSNVNYVLRKIKNSYEKIHTSLLQPSAEGLDQQPSLHRNHESRTNIKDKGNQSVNSQLPSLQPIQNDEPNVKTNNISSKRSENDEDQVIHNIYQNSENTNANYVMSTGNKVDKTDTQKDNKWYPEAMVSVNADSSVCKLLLNEGECPNESEGYQNRYIRSESYDREKQASNHHPLEGVQHSTNFHKSYSVDIDLESVIIEDKNYFKKVESDIVDSEYKKDLSTIDRVDHYVKAVSFLKSSDKVSQQSLLRNHEAVIVGNAKGEVVLEIKLPNGDIITKVVPDITLVYLESEWHCIGQFPTRSKIVFDGFTDDDNVHIFIFWKGFKPIAYYSTFATQYFDAPAKVISVSNTSIKFLVIINPGLGSINLIIGKEVKVFDEFGSLYDGVIEGEEYAISFANIMGSYKIFSISRSSSNQQPLNKMVAHKTHISSFYRSFADVLMEDSFVLILRSKDVIAVLLREHLLLGDKMSFENEGIGSYCLKLPYSIRIGVLTISHWALVAWLRREYLLMENIDGLFWERCKEFYENPNQKTLYLERLIVKSIEESEASNSSQTTQFQEKHESNEEIVTSQPSKHLDLNHENSATVKLSEIQIPHNLSSKLPDDKGLSKDLSSFLMTLGVVMNESFFLVLRAQENIAVLLRENLHFPQTKISATNKSVVAYCLKLPNPITICNLSISDWAVVGWVGKRKLLKENVDKIFWNHYKKFFQNPSQEMLHLEQRIVQLLQGTHEGNISIISAASSNFQEIDRGLLGCTLPAICKSNEVITLSQSSNLSGINYESSCILKGGQTHIQHGVSTKPVENKMLTNDLSSLLMTYSVVMEGSLILILKSKEKIAVILREHLLFTQEKILQTMYPVVSYSIMLPNPITIGDFSVSHWAVVGWIGKKNLLQKNADQIFWKQYKKFCKNPSKKILYLEDRIVQSLQSTITTHKDSVNQISLVPSDSQEIGRDSLGNSSPAVTKSNEKTASSQSLIHFGTNHENSCTVKCNQDPIQGFISLEPPDVKMMTKSLSSLFMTLGVVMISPSLLILKSEEKIALLLKEQLLLPKDKILTRNETISAYCIKLRYIIRVSDLTISHWAVVGWVGKRHLLQENVDEIFFNNYKNFCEQPSFIERYLEEKIILYLKDAKINTSSEATYPLATVKGSMLPGPSKIQKTDTSCTSPTYFKLLEFNSAVSLPSDKPKVIDKVAQIKESIGSQYDGLGEIPYVGRFQVLESSFYFEKFLLYKQYSKLYLLTSQNTYSLVLLTDFLCCVDAIEKQPLTEGSEVFGYVVGLSESLQINIKENSFLISGWVLVAWNGSATVPHPDVDHRFRKNFEKYIDHYDEVHNFLKEQIKNEVMVDCDSSLPKICDWRKIAQSLHDAKVNNSSQVPNLQTNLMINRSLPVPCDTSLLPQTCEFRKHFICSAQGKERYIIVYSVSGKVVHVRGNEGIIKLNPIVHCYFHKKVWFVDNKSLAQEAVSLFVKRMTSYKKSRRTFQLEVYECVEENIFGFPVRYSAALAWNKPKPKGDNFTIIKKASDIRILQRGLENKITANEMKTTSGKKKKKAVKQTAAITLLQQSNKLSSKVTPNPAIDCFSKLETKAAPSMTFKDPRLPSVQSEKKTMNPTLNDVYTAIPGDVPNPTAPVMKRNSNEIKNSKLGTVKDMDELRGELEGENQVVYTFTREKCFLFGISIYNFPLKDIIRAGCFAHYEVDGDDMIKEVLFGGEVSESKEKTYNSIVNWCLKMGVASEIKFQLLDATGWIPKNCEPIVKMGFKKEVISL